MTNDDINQAAERLISKLGYAGKDRDESIECDASLVAEAWLAEHQQDETWMITYRAWNQAFPDSKPCEAETNTVFTDKHPIAWRDEFLREHPTWQGCNVLFAIRGNQNEINNGGQA